MKKVLKENWKFMICVVLILAVLFPMIYTIFYSLPSADDFSMAAGCSKSTLFMDAVNNANRRFIKSSGLWPYMFLETCLNPVIHFELESYGVGVEMILLFFAFVISLSVLISTTARWVLGINSKECIAVFILVFLFVFLNTNIYKEVFYWFVGSSYMMAMIFGLVTITLTIKYFYDTKMKWRGVILLSVIGALACNFFQEAILPGTIYIVLWSYFSIKEGKPLWKKIIPLGIMVLSGVVAVAAPGNYARHARYDSSFNIFRAMIDAVKMALIIWKHLVQQPLVIALLVGCVYIGIRFGKQNVGKGCPLLAGILLLMASVLNAFPIVLGYGAVDLPNRIYFVLDFTVLVGMIVFAVSAGMYVKNLVWCRSFPSGHIEVFLVGFVVLLLYSTLVYNQNISKLPWSQTVAGIKEVKEYHDVWQNCLMAIRDSDEKDVEIEIEKEFFQSAILSLPRLSNNEENWINVAVARYYGKESVIVREKEKE